MQKGGKNRQVVRRKKELSAIAILEDHIPKRYIYIKGQEVQGVWRVVLVDIDVIINFFEIFGQFNTAEWRIIYIDYNGGIFPGN